MYVYKNFCIYISYYIVQSTGTDIIQASIFRMSTNPCHRLATLGIA